MKEIWKIKHFNKLTNNELYAILRLRSDVFVVEQNCIFLDQDNKDQKAFHLFCEDETGNVLACARLLAPGDSYPDESSIGRVCSAASERGTGIGQRLMEQSIHHTKHLFPNHTIRIGAQSYLLRFYGRLGFVPDGQEYMEDGIPHTEMLLKAERVE